MSYQQQPPGRPEIVPNFVPHLPQNRARLGPLLPRAVRLARCVSGPVKKNVSSAGLVDSGPVGGEAVQKLYSSFYMR